MFHMVDDDELVLEALSSIVNTLGYECKTFSSPVAYLKYMQSSDYQPPIALLSDATMPDMDGFQLLETVHQHHPEIRTAIISGYIDSMNASKEHVCVYLRKPFLIPALESMLKAFTLCHKDGCDSERFGCAAISDQALSGTDQWRCPLMNRGKK